MTVKIHVVRQPSLCLVHVAARLPALTTSSVQVVDEGKAIVGSDPARLVYIRDALYHRGLTTVDKT